MKLRGEELRAQKRPVKKGEVKVRKEVVTEQRTLDVPVTREEVVVRRRKVGAGEAVSASDLKPGEEIRIPVKEEQVHVEKTPVVTEEVRVGKRKTTGTQRVSGTVRREKARVEQSGDVDVCDDGAK